MEIDKLNIIFVKIKKMKNDYILFVFVTSDDQEEFVKTLGEQLCVISHDLLIRFYFGPTAIVYTISVTEPFENVAEYVNMILDGINCSYFLLPYNNDKMSVGLTDDIYQHLFGKGEPDSKLSARILTNDETTLTNDMVRKILEEEWIEDEDILMMKKEKISVDDVLDKISVSGIESLTKKELLVLDNFKN